MTEVKEKEKKETKTFTINADKLVKKLADLSDKEVEIRSASLKDALCNYGYELLQGKTAGDIINRKGTHIVHEDLERAFSKFRVFLAHLDDAYTGNDNATELETLEQEPETEKYFVTAFQITGVEENRSIVLQGGKWVKNGQITFSAPKVKLNGGYLYLDKLTNVLENAIREVEYYMNGKAAPQAEQTHMTFAQEDNAFENAKVEEEAS